MIPCKFYKLFANLSKAIARVALIVEERTTLGVLANFLWENDSHEPHNRGLDERVKLGSLHPLSESG
jgi:hypothetical protein